MSDYEVTLVNDSMQEFFVRFSGPAESKSLSTFLPHILPNRRHASSVLRWRLEDTRRITRPISLQVPKYRFYEQDFPS
jgi:hypothetical protein